MFKTVTADAKYYLAAACIAIPVLVQVGMIAADVKSSVANKKN